MGRNLRWWHLICVTGFTGLFVVPVLSLAFHFASLTSSLASAAGSGPPTGPRVGVSLIGALLVVSLVIAVPGLAVSVYNDAGEVAGDGWTPTPAVYGGLALLYPLSLIAAGSYLYRRYRRVGLGGFPVDEPLSRDRLGSSRWWYLIVLGPLLFLLGIGLFLSPPWWPTSFIGEVYLRGVVLGTFTGTGITLFNLGLAADLIQVRNSVVSWDPGKRRYQLPSILLPGLIPVLAAVYLVNRHRYVGVP